LINGTSLVVIAFFMVVEAIGRFIQPSEINNPINIIIVGSIGLVVNILGLVLFHKHHDHNHKHDHNLHGVFLHLLGDALGSIGVIITGICYATIPYDWKRYIDPIITILICAIILRTSIPLLRNSVKILLQSVPDGIDYNQIREDIEVIGGVLGVHELHIWLLVDKTSIATLHIKCLRGCDFMDVAQQIQDCFHKHNVHSITIQPEFVDSDEDVDGECMITCETKCRKHTCCKE
jgi:solute carrier family 30 (zinc transporter), member 1